LTIAQIAGAYGSIGANWIKSLNALESHYAKKENYETDYRKSNDDDDRYDDSNHPHKKRKSFLGDFFDFD